MINKTKICTKCKIRRPATDFYKRSNSIDGLSYWCKECANKNSKEWYENNKEKVVMATKRWCKNNPEKVVIINKKWRENNKEKVVRNKQWREKNKEKIIMTQKRYCKKHPEKIIAMMKRYRKNNSEKIVAAAKQWRERNKEKIVVAAKQYYENNKEKIAIVMKQYRQSTAGKLSRKRVKEKTLSTPKGKLNQRMSIAINKSLKAKGVSKAGSHWETLVGYKVIKLKQYLEKQFVDGMDWGNYGKWHIDHKRPIVSFNYDDCNNPDFKKCWDLKNLQPLWAKDNSSKGAKLNWGKVNQQ